MFLRAMLLGIEKKILLVTEEIFPGSPDSEQLMVGQPQCYLRPFSHYGRLADWAAESIVAGFRCNCSWLEYGHSLSYGYSGVMYTGLGCLYFLCKFSRRASVVNIYLSQNG